MSDALGTPKNTMRAVVWEGHVGSISVKDVPRPTLKLPEDAIVRVTTAGLCGSDLHTYHGHFGSSTPPWILGHEAVGVVVEVGNATEHFKVGDRVFIPGAPSSGHFSVEQTATQVPQTYGFGPDFGVDGGCQAEYVRVPFADDSLVAIPDKYSSDLDWLCLTDIFATAWMGLNLAHFEPGDKVAIFGAGPVGLMCAYAAKLRGASRVYCVDHIRARLDKAASLGAIPIDFTHEDGPASKQILDREPQGVLRVIDCWQQNYIISEALKIVSVNGGITLVGGYAALPETAGTPNGSDLDAELLVAIPALWLKSVTLTGSIVNDHLYEMMPQLMDLVRTGTAKLDWVVSAQMGIEDAPEAYRRFDEKLETKIVFRFPWVHGDDNVEEAVSEKPRKSKLPLHKGRRPFRGLN
ncbi:chaperonin 10-like protein [Stachybotrys elegans]|uniref:Chaperonin 10-like protein n=1 Tax=Stachybotrys elegans TaxID=80388 RepID=A0A8K0SP69_9HYPO|nr:chaperonin 10-like protein [Stachybotrys elegans]